MEPLWRRIGAVPPVEDRHRAETFLDELANRLAGAQAAGDEARRVALLGDPAVTGLLAATFGASPYLTGLSLRDPDRLMTILATAPEDRFQELTTGLAEDLAHAHGDGEAMRLLRRYKSDVALASALADIAGVWGVGEVTAALSRAGDAVLSSSVGFLLRQAVAKGDLIATGPEPIENAIGYFVIAMGKYGAGELNYSSDIDLIVLFEPGRARLREGVEPQKFFVDLTRKLVRFMQENTADGYVFRADLRLRPDPGSTQIALSSEAALLYYESFGQNWERAALIKARVVAGDIAAGEEFLARLTPFIWRKYLDFAAISDIHAMKRQVQAFKGFGRIGVVGHNIKLGRGGIREIEFFAQTQQLIAGGRQGDLRVAQTLAALAKLVERGWISSEIRADLEAAYLFLRHVEHRLQMIADEQTQTLPQDPEKLSQVAHFCGFHSIDAFSETLCGHLQRVQSHYGALFEVGPALTTEQGNLVFTGDGNDPATLETLARMGFAAPERVIQTVRGWHFARYPAMRSEKARERLTQFQPDLLDALAKTADPDLALSTFDRFLSELPAGVQLFALLANNPNLLRLIADIMGTAPRLARILSRRRRTIEAVLDPGFFGALPSKADLKQIISEGLGGATDYQDILDRARTIGSEQAFLIGVRVLSGTVRADQAGRAYGALAENLIKALAKAVACRIAEAHGRLADGNMAVIAMGKLGGCEMTATSDLDLITVYDFDDANPVSDGRRPLSGGAYFARTMQRLISALSAPTAEGTLYEVDMRLRPSGNAGPVATRLASFEAYQREDAWTWEHMALTRARVISGPLDLRRPIERIIADVLRRPRPRDVLVHDVLEMRQRIASEKPARGIWDLKQVRGGLVDLEFIAQYLQLLWAKDSPQVLNQNTLMALENLAEAGHLSPDHAGVLIPATRLVHNLTQVLRLCVEGTFVAEEASDGLKALLARAGECPDFATLEAALGDSLGRCHEIFREIVS